MIEKKETNEVVMLYNITIYNDSDALVYDESIQAKNENEAIMKALQKVNIYSGDKIIIS